MNDLVEVKIPGPRPDCDFCLLAEDDPRYRLGISNKINKADYDAKSTEGPWAYMCREHFNRYGTGLGTGVGQRLVIAGEEEEL